MPLPELSFTNLFHWFFGAYWIIQGLNGFFRWFSIPFVSSTMDQFMTEFNKAHGLMTVIKIVEIIAGMFIFLQILNLLSWFLFLPLVFGIVVLHLNFNPKPLKMLIWIGIFYIPFTYFHYSDILKLLHT